MVPTFTPQPVSRRSARHRRRAGLAAGGIGGLLAAGLLPTPAGAAPAAPATPAARSAAAVPTRPVDTGPQVSATVSAAMDCSAPTDGRIVRTANITRGATDYGDVQLWYSPACRSVTTVAFGPAA